MSTPEPMIKKRIDARAQAIMSMEADPLRQLLPVSPATPAEEPNHDAGNQNVLNLTFITEELSAASSTSKIEHSVALHAILQWAATAPTHLWQKTLATPKAASDAIRELYWTQVSKEEAFRRCFQKVYNPDDAKMVKDFRIFLADVKRRIENFFTAQSASKVVAALFVKLCEARGIENVKEALGAEVIFKFETVSKLKPVWKAQAITLPRIYQASFPQSMVEPDEGEADATPSDDQGFLDGVEIGQPVEDNLAAIGRLLPQGRPGIIMKRHAAQQLQAQIDHYTRLYSDKVRPLQQNLNNLMQAIKSEEKEDEAITVQVLLQTWASLYGSKPAGRKKFKEALAANICLRERKITKEQFLQEIYGDVMTEKGNSDETQNSKEGNSSEETKSGSSIEKSDATTVTLEINVDASALQHIM